MKKIIEAISSSEIYHWSEEWSILIPLAIYFIYKPKAKWIKPVFYFLIVAFIFGSLADIIFKRKSLGLNDWFKENLWWWWDDYTDPKTGKVFPVFKNLILYNLLSLSRLIFFGWFFTYFYQVYKTWFPRILAAFLFLAFINYLALENIKDFSSIQHTVETAILLVFCLIFFYKLNMDENIASTKSLPQFWVVVGLTLYIAVCFPIYLFYNYLTTQEKNYSIEVWIVHNFFFVVLNIFIAISFYRSSKYDS